MQWTASRSLRRALDPRLSPLSLPSHASSDADPPSIPDMSNLPKIRPARTEEAEEISKLAMRSKAHWGYSKSFMEACRDELTVTPRALDSSEFRYFVAERGSELVGYYAIDKLTDHRFELEALFVEPAFIGRGIGKALLAHAKKLVKELGGKSLIIQGDPHAEKFYRAAGGKPGGSRESASVPGRNLPLFRIDLASGDAP